MLNKMNRTQRITFTAFLSALSIVLTRFCAVTIPLGGYPSLSLELGGVPMVLGGIILGPISGGIIGFIADIIGFLINPRGGAYYFGFTLNSILTGVLPGLIFVLIRKKFLRDGMFPVINYILLGVFACAGILYTQFVSIDNLLIQDRLIALIAVVVVIICMYVVLILLSHHYKKDALEFNQIVFAVMVVEFCVYVCLTPLWINLLYGLPYVISMASRVFRMMFSIPIKSLLVFACIKALRIPLNKKKDEENPNG